MLVCARDTVVQDVQTPLLNRDISMLCHELFSRDMCQFCEGKINLLKYQVGFVSGLFLYTHHHDATAVFSVCDFIIVLASSCALYAS